MSFFQQQLTVLSPYIDMPVILIFSFELMQLNTPRNAELCVSFQGSSLIMLYYIIILYYQAALFAPGPLRKKDVLSLFLLLIFLELYAKEYLKIKSVILTNL